MSARYMIECEDATRYLPHDPTGVQYQHFVYDLSRTDRHPITGTPQRYLAYSGTRDQCEAFVANAEGRS